ncbi:MAG TPA: FAD-binding oxidoreductase [Acidimicrobiales bacterium]|nr:FAD-binding oxidoreductase [Acidimicrobiales bacterium]
MTVGKLEIFVGWGRNNGTGAKHLKPRNTKEVASLVERSPRCIARGLGRAYGDAAQCAGGAVIDCTGLGEILEFDVGTGVIRVEAGCSLDELSRYSVARGWFVPVTPGTAFVTIGGAVAADVHGKNHHREGSIARYVEEICLVTQGGPRTIGPNRDPDLFWATCGGMGLTGVITEVSLQLMPIATSSISVDTDRARDLDSCMEMLASGDENYRYSVAWVDARTRGRGLGRSIVTRGDHAKVGDLVSTQRNIPLSYNPVQRVRVPFTPPVSMVNALTLPVFNALWYHKAPKHRLREIQSMNAYFYPLDMLGDWNRLYGPKGFTQYQMVVPFGEEHVVRYTIERLQEAGCPSALGVLKRFGEGGPSPLSFPMPGWTLALDIPLGSAELAIALDDCDRHVANAGGRVYLAKDGRLRPELMREMYPRLDEFIEICHRTDPQGIFVSDLSRRIGLTPAPPTHRKRMNP